MRMSAREKMIVLRIERANSGTAGTGQKCSMAGIKCLPFNICAPKPHQRRGPRLYPVPLCPNAFLIGRVGGDTLVTNNLIERVGVRRFSLGDGTTRRSASSRSARFRRRATDKRRRQRRREILYVQRVQKVIVYFFDLICLFNRHSDVIFKHQFDQLHSVYGDYPHIF